MNFGQHIIVDMFHVPDIKFTDLLSKSNIQTLYEIFEILLKENKMNVIGKTTHHFTSEYDGAMTCLYLLSESHLSMHTWPEKNYISLDCYTCGVCNTQNIVNEIIKLFRPLRVHQKVIQRGCDESDVITTNLVFDDNTCVTYRDIEDNLSLFSLNYKNHKILDEKQTIYQKITITENEKYGKCLFIDNTLQVCENDIDAYNIAMTCKMMQQFRSNGKTDLQLLILGGGDGFLMEHLIAKYNDIIQSIVVVELDSEVTNMTDKYFRNGISCFTANKKITYINNFGDTFVKTTNAKFDGIIIDCTDYNPNAPSSGLFSPEFYKQCYTILNPGGYITQQYSEVNKFLDDTGNVCYPKIETHLNYHFAQDFIFSYGVPLIILHMTDN